MFVGSAKIRIALTILLTTIASASAHAVIAQNPGDGVDNFRLNDDKGESHELYYLSDMKAVVLLAHGIGCASETAAAKGLQQLRSKYQSQGVEFLLIDSNLQDTREAVTKDNAKNKIDMPVLMDPTQLIGESLSLTKNGEALVINTKDWKLAYRGSVTTADRNNVTEVLEALTNNGAVKTRVTQAMGCAIDMPERDQRVAHAKISYAKTIAPMLLDKCVACHRPGGIGPWAMSDYNVVRGFAPMIREVVRTQRMPPWHADPHYGTFSNDRSLSTDQIKTLVHWVEAGAPRDAGDDPLLTQTKTWPEWTLGKPDLIIETPPYSIPATGVIPYRMVTVSNPLTRDVWIRASDYLPGNRGTIHHVIGTASTGRIGFGGEFGIGSYVPGAGPLIVPEDNGIFLPRGAQIKFQMHYTPNGKAVANDVMRFGLYFLKEPPKFTYQAMVLTNLHLSIPANTKRYSQSLEGEFWKDALIFSLNAHAHFRGRSAKFVAYFPDGHKETLLNVPQYDFNWQSTYTLKKPKLLPAHSRIVYTMVWDNSAQNKANPDPNRVVPYGQQSWDEMLYCIIRYRNAVKRDSSDYHRAATVASREKMND